jgi:hypothetical protein
MNKMTVSEQELTHESPFNEALIAALPWLKSTYPIASAVQSAHVKGSASVTLKIQL